MTASSKQPPKSSPHSRFIPREEIDAVSAWTFSSMDPAEDIPEPVSEPQPAAIDEDALQTAREHAYAEGFARGLQKAGYATDPEYASKLSRAINTALNLQRAQA